MVVRVGHPLTKGKISKRKIFQFPHVVVEMTEDCAILLMAFSMTREFSAGCGASGLCWNLKTRMSAS